VQGGKLCNLHGRIDTKIGIDTDPILEESGQGRRRQNILYKELAVNVLGKWKTWSKKIAVERKRKEYEKNYVSLWVEVIVLAKFQILGSCV
jgi:hypothetical protein